MKSKINEKFPLHQAVINAAIEAGYDYTKDPNGFKQDGFCTFDLTIDKGKRYGAGKAYLKEALKSKSHLSYIIKLLGGGP